jgi:hypothetical protein
VDQPLVAARGRHARPDRRDLLRPLRAGRARDPAGHVHLAVDQHRRRRSPPAGALLFGQLHQWRWRAVGDHRYEHRTRPQGVEPVHHVAQRRVQSQPERHPVLRHVHRCVGRAALHLRASGAEDADAHLAAGLHLHAHDVAPGLRVAVRLQGDVLERARGGRCAGERLRRALQGLRRSGRRG